MLSPSKMRLFTGTRGLLIACAAALLLIFPSSLCAAAQTSTGGSTEMRTVTGEVLDQSNSPLPRTLVEVFDGNGGRIASAQTDSRGSFTFSLAEGNYTVTATLAGLVPLMNQPLTVAAVTPPLRLTLKIPPLEQQIIVTATNTAVPLAQVGGSVTLISGDQLSREGIATVADALRRVAGVNLVQSGGVGQVTSLFVRGGDSDYTKVMIDGIAVNEPGGSFNFANMSTTGIDRIEVVRGPQSALFGSDAVAGVVQIFTKRGTSEGLSPAPGVLVEGGTFATYRYGAQIQGKGEHMDYLASFTRFDTDNNVANGSFNEETFTGNLGLAPSHSTELRAVFRSEYGRTGTPGQWAFGRPDLDAYYRLRDLAGGLTFTHTVSSAWTQKLSYSVSDSHQYSADPIDSGSYIPQFEGHVSPFPFLDFTFQNLSQTRRQRVNYQSDLVLPYGNILTAGAEYERESGVIGDPDADPVKAIRNNYSAFAQDQWALRNRLFTAVGVRFEHNDSFGFFAAPRVSLAFHAHQPTPGSIWGLTKIKGNFGLGIKEPTLVESFADSPRLKGNPDLRPERAVSFDAGIEQFLASGRGSLEVTYFENHYRDQVGFEITNPVTFEGSFRNIGKTRARGVETILRGDLGWNWGITGAYTFTDSKVVESSSSFDPVFAEGQELFRRPAHSGYLDLRWSPGRWTLGATGIFVGRRVDSDFSSLVPSITSNPGYGTLNFIAGFRLANALTLFGALNNALDKNYMEVLGYPALGRNFRIGLRAGM